MRDRVAFALVLALAMLSTLQHGKVFLLSEDGHPFVIEAGDT